jgi:putative transposase
MALTLNGYSRFFNEKHRRIGPLWQGRFKSVLVTSNEQLLHLTRYIHLNPVSAGLVEKPECWDFSSYNEFLQTGSASEGLCSYGDLIDLSVAEYKKFVDDRKDYQRKISIIKHQLIEDYSG